MEKAPGIKKPEVMTIKQIRERIGQIDASIIALEGRLNKIPGENELGTSLEDDGLEGEANAVSFGFAANEIGELRKEKQELEEKLERLIDIEKAA